MGEVANTEQVERLKMLLKIARGALNDIYQGKLNCSPEMKAAEALDKLDLLWRWEAGQ